MFTLRCSRNAAFLSSRRNSRWLTREAVIAKRDRRRLERKWRSSRDEVDFVAYRRMCRAANTAIIKSRHDYYSKRIGAAGSDPRKRWSVIRDVLHQTERHESNTNADCQSLCDRFVDFFDDKIRKIKSLIAQRLNGTESDPTVSDAVFAGEPLTALLPPSVDEITKLISAMPAKSSLLDAIPTSIIKSSRSTDC